MGVNGDCWYLFGGIGSFSKWRCVPFMQSNTGTVYIRPLDIQIG